jgi:hypothetical protein
MARKVVVRGERREQIDTEQLAIAFLMLARILQEQEEGSAAADSSAQEDDEAA